MEIRESYMLGQLRQQLVVPLWRYVLNISQTRTEIRKSQRYWNDLPCLSMKLLKTFVGDTAASEIGYCMM